MEKIEELEKYIKEVSFKIKIMKYNKVEKELYLLMLELKKNRKSFTFELNFKETLN